MDRFIVIVVLMTWSGMAVAEKPASACQSFASAGLIWQNGRWVDSSFTPEQPFVLVMSGDTLTPESVASAMRGAPVQWVHCRNIMAHIACSALAGTFLYFSAETARGSIAFVIGSTTTDTVRRDTHSIDPFTCQKI